MGLARRDPGWDADRVNSASGPGRRLDEPVPTSDEQSSVVVAPVRDITRAVRPTAGKETLVFEFLPGADTALRQVFPVTYDIVLDHDEAVATPADPAEDEGPRTGR